MSVGPYFAVMSNLKKLEGYDPIYTWTWPRNTLAITGDDKYPEYAEGLEIGALYHYEEEEYYFLLNSEQDMYFFEWREKLVQMVGQKSVDEADGQYPFCELIRHRECADCTTIGPLMSERIASDFDAWEYVARSTGDARFLEYYEHIRRPFELARGNGAVSLYAMA
ncbi:hypothetical protein [Cupriavidus metallidurans]|uniref:hypothetical protein n=1 Tax=Cupriavidus metallidurans TaxID=119219 RepID=UPI00056CBFE9|nr:hypothetical protein [Cupriavidus metallidurans]